MGDLEWITRGGWIYGSRPDRRFLRGAVPDRAA